MAPFRASRNIKRSIFMEELKQKFIKNDKLDEKSILSELNHNDIDINDIANFLKKFMQPNDDKSFKNYDTNFKFQGTKLKEISESNSDIKIITQKEKDDILKELEQQFKSWSTQDQKIMCIIFDAFVHCFNQVEDKDAFAKAIACVFNSKTSHEFLI